jgi:hypothetical protein
MPVGNDPLNPDTVALLENRGEFFGEVLGDVRKEFRHHRVIDVNKPW